MRSVFPECGNSLPRPPKIAITGAAAINCRTPVRRIFLLFFTLITLAISGACGNGESRIPLTVLEGDGPKARQEFSVELELTPAERAQGMMFRKELGTDHGMLFIFPQPVDHSFWMRNTLIPLDIIFIGADKKIVNIVARAEPQTDTPREPDGFYQYTLEIEGGRAEALGIQAGDAMVFELPAGAIVK